MSKINKNNNNNNNNNNNKMQFPAHSLLTRGPAGKVIRRLPEFKATFPRVYVHFDEGVWTVSGSMDFKAVKEWIQAAELQAIASLSAPHSFPTKVKEEAQCDNADQRKQLTGVLIRHLKELQLPLGAKPVWFDNHNRVWLLRAENHEALLLLEKAFDVYERKWFFHLNPSVRGEVHIDELSKKSKQITSAVNASLKKILLPHGSKPIWFNYDTFSWEFTCQTQHDLDELIHRFKHHAEHIINHPLPKMTVPLLLQQQLPDFNADFPPITNPTV
jgi:hypothetical protein